MDHAHCVPPQILSTSPVFAQENGKGLLALPLSQVVDIVSYLYDPADIARVVRTCRLLHYVTLPLLYASVSLHAYPDIRYAKGRPRGHGSASPFVCGLNTLVTRNVSNLVRHFSLSGHMKEYDLEEYARAGRVPDPAFMTNTLVRAALDRMPNLQSFSWTLNIRMSQSVYEGLAKRSNIKSLEVNFSSSRVPSPILTIPALPNLERLKITNLDPLCFNDDISLVLLHATKLQELILAWSPRIPKERDSSVALSVHFGKLAQNGVKLKVKSMTVKNLYARFTTDPQTVFDFSVIESITSLRGLTRGGDDLSLVFMEDSWKAAPVKELPSVKFIRQDEPNRVFLDTFHRVQNVEKIYFVGPPCKNAPNGDSETPPYSNSDNYSTPTSVDQEDDVDETVKSQYLEHIAKKSGPSVRHLLLPTRWYLDDVEVCQLTEACPNIEQFALRVKPHFGSRIDLIVDRLKHLRVLRILSKEPPAAPGNTPPDEEEAFNEVFGIKILEKKLASVQIWTFEWLQISRKIFRIRWIDVTNDNLHNAGSGALRRPSVKAATLEDVKDIEIWALDSYDI